MNSRILREVASGSRVVGFSVMHKLEVPKHFEHLYESRFCRKAANRKH